MSLRQPPSTLSSCLLLTHRRLFLPPKPLSLPTFPSLSRHVSLPPRDSSSFNGAILQEELVFGDDGGFRNADKVRGWSWADSVRSILPGGTWWELPEDVQVKLMAKPVTLWRALSRMWDLVARDRWVIYAAFSALILAAVLSLLPFSFCLAVFLMFFCF